MNTLILKHNGHETHVPYELPDSLRFDCFVPGQGMCVAYVDPRAEEILVLEVHRPKKSSLGTDGTELLPPELCNHPAVLEQAGDVCAVFERALGAKQWIASPDHDSVQASDWRVLSTIAEMAILESDLHTSWSRLPFEVADIKLAPTQVPTEWAAAKCLERFIAEVLVPRVQDIATAAAKRREAEWNARLDCEPCGGSGEGSHPEASCVTCGGSGVDTLKAVAESMRERS